MLYTVVGLTTSGVLTATEIACVLVHPIAFLIVIVPVYVLAGKEAGITMPVMVPPPTANTKGVEAWSEISGSFQ